MRWPAPWLVMNPNTGEILAMSNWPRFNPNAASEAPAESRMNRAVDALYEPGSTFKRDYAGGGVRSGSTGPRGFDARMARSILRGTGFATHKPFGLLSVSEILAKSSDVGAIKIAVRLGAPRFFDYIRAVGFGSPTGIDLLGKAKGSCTGWKIGARFRSGLSRWDKRLGVTPIQFGHCRIGDCEWWRSGQATRCAGHQARGARCWTRLGV